VTKCETAVLLELSSINRCVNAGWPEPRGVIIPNKFNPVSAGLEGFSSVARLKHN
jgi:hypothetical protein